MPDLLPGLPVCAGHRASAERRHPAVRLREAGHRSCAGKAGAGGQERRESSWLVRLAGGAANATLGARSRPRPFPHFSQARLAGGCGAGFQPCVPVPGGPRPGGCWLGAPAACCWLACALLVARPRDTSVHLLSCAAFGYSWQHLMPPLAGALLCRRPPRPTSCCPPACSPSPAFTWRRWAAPADSAR